MTTVDRRVDAALEVLAGRPAVDVAAAYGVEEELVLRWRDLLVDGGRLRLAGRMDPSSFEARERFLTLIAHELRTPLAVIKGWVETMRTTDLGPDVEAQALAAMAKQVDLLERMARNALDAGAVARNELRLSVRPLDLRGLVDGVLRSLQEPAGTLAAGTAVEVVADGARLEQVTGELLAHARRLARVQALQVTVGGTADAATVTVAVPGGKLSFDEAAELFEPYGRSDTSVGTGLGLFLSRALVSAHGGEIGVRSDGATTEFWYRLPLCGPEPGPHVERTQT